MQPDRGVLPLQEPHAAAPGSGHERTVHHQPVHRARHVRSVLPAGRVLHHQVEDDEQTAPEVTAVLQEVPARIVTCTRYQCATCTAVTRVLQPEHFRVQLTIAVGQSQVDVGVRIL